MATIVHRPGRKLPWLARIRKKGHSPTSKAFRLESQAKAWGRAKEDKLAVLDAGKPDDSLLASTTVGFLIKKYLEEETDKKLSAETERYRIESSFLKHKISKKALNLITPLDAVQYRSERLKDITRSGTPVTLATVKREVAILKHIFRKAIGEWGFHGINNGVNPFDRLDLKGADNPRSNRVSDEDLEKLLNCALQYLYKYNKIIMPLGICLALTTGMRRGEILNLRVPDVWPIEERRIRIRSSKTDRKTGKKGRTIVMSPQAAVIITAHVSAYLSNPNGRRILKLLDKDDPELPLKYIDVPMFPVSAKSFQKSWEVLRKRAGLEHINFHDLRHEAASRFAEMDLNVHESNLMLGHSDRTMNSRYTHIEDTTRVRIQKKMDKALELAYPDEALDKEPLEFSRKVMHHLATHPQLIVLAVRTAVYTMRRLPAVI